jgi:hypothetical protein
LFCSVRQLIPTAVQRPQGAATCSSGSDPHYPYLVSFILIKGMITFQVIYHYSSPKLGCKVGCLSWRCQASKMVHTKARPFCAGAYCKHDCLVILRFLLQDALWCRRVYSTLPMGAALHIQLCNVRERYEGIICTTISLILYFAPGSINGRCKEVLFLGEEVPHGTTQAW